jgi:HD superfamily phosphohydrolase
MSAQAKPDPRKAIRDPIHGLIPRYSDEIRIMDTRVFQRLRGIRQLAMAHLVYPGAVHTRFDHSLGTMHVAGKICERLSEFKYINPQETKAVRLAALLHDIGHGPFSHVSELLLDRHYDKDKVGILPERERIHEKITLQIIQQNKEIQDILSPKMRADIVALLSDTGERDFKRDIVSGPVDADKMDYLRRDSYFAGVEYGRFDLEKIVDVCRVAPYRSESYLVLDHEGVYAVEQFVMAKYHMGQQVYFHRVRSITDAMLVRGVTMAINAGDELACRVFRYDGSQAFLDAYLSVDDEEILQALRQSADAKVRELFSRLGERRLFKQVCELPPETVDHALARGSLLKLDAQTPAARALEERIGEKLGVDPDFVIVTKWSVRNPTYRPAGYQIEPGDIMILDKNNTVRKIDEFPGLIFSFNKDAASLDRIHVYAPMDEWNQPGGGTDQERGHCEQAVRQILISNAS